MITMYKTLRIIPLIVALGAGALSGCTGRSAEAQAPAATVAPSTSTSTTTTSTTIPATTTTAPPTPSEIVNGLIYSVGDAAPATEAYRVVAEARGWSPTQIAEWEPFVVGLMWRESRYCPNVRRGAVLAHGPGCVLERQGTGVDSGFGQVIDMHYRPGKFLCADEGLCSADDVVTTPWNSMTALLALLERNGRQPWCYTASLRATGACRTAPSNPPAIPAT